MSGGVRGRKLGEKVEQEIEERQKREAEESTKNQVNIEQIVVFF